MVSRSPHIRRGFALFADSPRKQTPLFDASRRLYFYESAQEAERAVARITVKRVQSFLRGEIEFEDAMRMPEYVAPAVIEVNGTVVALEQADPVQG